MNSRYGWTLRLGFTVGCLYVIVQRVSVDEVVHALAAVRVGYVIAALGLAIGVIYLGAWRLKWLTDEQGMSLSVHRIVEIQLITMFYGLLLPGLLAGGAIGWYRLAQRDRKMIEALAAIIVGRIFWALSLAGTGVVFLLLEMGQAQDRAASLLVLALLSALCLLCLLAFHGGVVSAFQGWLTDGRGAGIFRFVRQPICKLLAAVSHYHQLSARRRWGMVGLGVAESLVGVLVTYLFVMALSIDISLVSIAWIRSFLVLVVMLPISISGLGVREGMLGALLAPYGVSGGEAVALAFLLFIGLVAMGGIGGLLEVSTIVRSRQGMPRRAADALGQHRPLISDRT